MSIIEIAKEYAPLLNALVLLLVLIQFVATSRRHRMELEKLGRELSELRQRESEAAARLLNLVAEDINQRVIGPLVESLQKRDQELQNAHRRLLEAFYQSNTTIQEKTLQRDKELVSSQRLVVEAFYNAAEEIRRHTEAAAVGSKLAALIQENTQALRALRAQGTSSAEPSDTNTPVSS
jgi:hypothetical protein